MKIQGTASDSTERFDFTIEDYVGGGYILYIAFSGDERSNITGGGVWPTVEKAKSIAQETATKLLHGAVVGWSTYDARP